MEEVSKAREGRRKSDARKHEGRAWKQMARDTKVNHCGDRECHETTLNLNSQSDHAQNNVHSWYLLFSFCPMMSFVQKKKTTTTTATTTTKQKGKRKAGVKAKYSQFLFLRHIFVWHPSAFLHIWLSGNKSATAITLLHRLYHNYTFLTANKSFCTLS